jgi:hypothetical protein
VIEHWVEEPWTEELSKEKEKTQKYLMGHL